MGLLARLLGPRPKATIPQYSVLVGMKPLPALADVLQREAAALETRHDAVQEALRRSPAWPGPQDPSFTLIDVPAEGATATITGPDGLVLPVFTSPIKAEDYRLTLFPRRPIALRTLSAVDLLVRLREGRELGVAGWAIDPCPRCTSFTVYGIDSLHTADDVLILASIVRATERLRAETGVSVALELARAGDFRMASYSVLCSLQHVTLEEPQLHLLLGKLAILYGPRTAAKEAPPFLRLLRQPQLAEQLEREIVAWDCDLDTVVIPVAESVPVG